MQSSQQITRRDQVYNSELSGIQKSHKPSGPRRDRRLILQQEVYKDRFLEFKFDSENSSINIEKRFLIKCKNLNSFLPKKDKIKMKQLTYRELTDVSNYYTLEKKFSVNLNNYASFLKVSYQFGDENLKRISQQWIIENVKITFDNFLELRNLAIITHSASIQKQIKKTIIPTKENYLELFKLAIQNKEAFFLQKKILRFVSDHNITEFWENTFPQVKALDLKGFAFENPKIDIKKTFPNLVEGFYNEEVETDLESCNDEGNKEIESMKSDEENKQIETMKITNLIN